jgi:ssDNA-binding Zn-finger/Zn-ribbon topoisomerase 1
MTRTVERPAVEYPAIKFVSYPVHLDGTRTGAQPSMRHFPGCGHFDSGDGAILGIPELATEKQMQTLVVCKSCMGSRGLSTRGAASVTKESRIGAVCPTCSQQMPLTGTCDRCA